MKHTYRAATFTFIVGGMLIIAGLFMLTNVPTVQAQDAPAPTGDDSYCLVCHGQPGQSYTLADGSSVDLSVDPTVIAQSVHGDQNESGALGCVDCHGDSAFPHNQTKPATARLLTIQSSAACTTCHEDQTADMVDSVHYRALLNGNQTAATCTDCHGAHNVQKPDEPREQTSTTCGECHQVVFAEYETSVHGEALYKGDANAPTCTDCHGVHGIQNPTNALFRNRSPELCATCHADAEMMAQYDISTNVFDSYLTDFHGSTVALFEQQDPSVATNKAVCFDCHGVHDIARADDDKSRVVRQKLLETCQSCHPGATSDFPDAWVGHFPPTIESHPLMFIVNLFYAIVIPVTIGGMLLLVATDVFRRIRTRLRGG
jgi:predicted CXXCH cytochrome family protein